MSHLLVPTIIRRQAERAAGGKKIVDEEDEKPQQQPTTGANPPTWISKENYHDLILKTLLKNGIISDLSPQYNRLVISTHANFVNNALSNQHCCNNRNNNNISDTFDSVGLQRQITQLALPIKPSLRSHTTQVQQPQQQQPRGKRPIRKDSLRTSTGGKAPRSMHDTRRRVKKEPKNDTNATANNNNNVDHENTMEVTHDLSSSMGSTSVLSPEYIPDELAPFYTTVDPCQHNMWIPTHGNEGYCPNCNYSGILNTNRE